MLANIAMVPLSRCARFCLLSAFIIPSLVIVTFWYALNSDRDDIPALMTQLIPAGHATCHTATIFQCSSCLEPQDAYNVSHHDRWEFRYERDGQNEGLEEEKCHAAFPGLYEDVNQGVSYWKRQGRISTPSLDKVRMEHGMTRAMIYNGLLYVVETKSTAEDHRRKAIAVLSSMHRALSAAQDKAAIPNIEFVFSIEDKATDVGGSSTQPLWVLARKATEQAFFLLPDFGFWAWDNIIEGKNNEIGPFDEVVDKAVTLENAISFDDKIPQLVWRGKLSFAPKLRRALLDASRGAQWNNVKEVNWKVKDNYLTLEDHCKYMFIAHVEGRSYSASLKYRQACRSVIVSHRLQYIQHHHYLLVSNGTYQNFVEVERDFSDLTEKMDDMMANPEKAQRIANNSVKTFREKYLTPAAEACYWRALWKGYGSVSEPAHLWHDSVTGKRKKRGLRFETFLLLSSDEMLDFKVETG